MQRFPRIMSLRTDGLPANGLTMADGRLRHDSGSADTVSNRANKRPRGLHYLLVHLPYENKLGLCLIAKYLLHTYIAEVTHICVTSINESQISLRFAPRPVLSRYRHIERSALNDHTVTLYHTKSNISHRCVTSVPETQIYSILFCGQPFCDTGHFETNAPNDSKWSWTLQGQMYPIYVLPLSSSPKFHSIWLYDQPFSSYSHFETSARNDPKRILNSTR